MRSWLKGNGWLLGGGLLFLILKIPALFDPFTYGDEGIYLTLGLAARKGLTWYRDMHDNKPPLLYLIAALSGNFFTYRLIHVVWSWVTIVVFWLMTKLIYPVNKKAQKLVTLVFVILTSIPLFEGNVGNAENFMMLPTIAGFYLLYEWLKTRPKNKLLGIPTRVDKITLLGIGTLFGLAALFKIPAGFDFTAAIAFVLVMLYRSKKDLLRITIVLALLIGGFLLPMVISLGYYFVHGAGREYLWAAFGQNIPYLSSWQTGNHQGSSGFPTALLGRLWFTLAVAVGGWLLKNQVGRTAILAVIWFAFGWFGSLLSTRPYPHYLLQLMPPLCLSLGLWVSRRRLKNIIPLALAAGTLITFVAFGFWQYPISRYYARFYRFALTGQSPADYRQNFDPTAPEVYDTAAYIRQRTFPQERIFIWGTRPSIYALSERLPVGRYTAAYHIIDFEGTKETIKNLLEHQPRFLIVDREEKSPFSELAALIQNEYGLEKTVGSIKIYRRLK